MSIMSNVKRHINYNFIFAVGIGGMIGSILRYSITVGLNSRDYLFPWDTVVINLIGSFLLAFLLALSVEKLKLSPVTFTFFTTGILGSFTTFSTIIVDFHQLIALNLFHLIIYITITFLGGLFMALIGFVIGKRI